VRTSLKRDSGEEIWRERSFFVEESQLVSHVWMPTTLKTIAQSSALGDVFSTRKVKISDMSHGTVTESDVSLTFPEGTEVTDAIEGISYKTDASGNAIPSTMEYLYDFDPSHAAMPLPESKDRTVNYVLIVIGIVLILIALYMMLHQRRRNAS